MHDAVGFSGYVPIKLSYMTLAEPEQAACGLCLAELNAAGMHYI